MSKLKEKGYKLTIQRRQLVETMHKVGRRLTAREVHGMLQKRTPSIGLDTVYRNLRLLCEIGMVHQISLHSGAVYELAVGQHHHHLVCIGCEKVICLPHCPEIIEYTEQAASEGFAILGHSFELFGICPSCQKYH
jgi:Fe2+ or Zn2+ uptake regulation protein